LARGQRQGVRLDRSGGSVRPPGRRSPEVMAAWLVDADEGSVGACRGSLTTQGTLADGDGRSVCSRRTRLAGIADVAVPRPTRFGRRPEGRRRLRRRPQAAAPPGGVAGVGAAPDRLIGELLRARRAIPLHPQAAGGRSAAHRRTRGCASLSQRKTPLGFPSLPQPTAGLRNGSTACERAMKGSLSSSLRPARLPAPALTLVYVPW